MKCEICKKKTVRRSNSQKYCKDCAYKWKLFQVRMYKQKGKPERCHKCRRLLQLVPGETHTFYCPYHPEMHMSIG